MQLRQHDLEIVGEAEAFDGLVAGAEAAAPNVKVNISCCSWPSFEKSTTW